MQTSTGQETHGITASDFAWDAELRPLAGSPLIDAGVIIPGVNDGYSGAAPDIGAIEFAPAVPAILRHHEHFDGTGYPDGLAGDDIPLASRILLVTDAFDAMTTDRPYRRAMPIEAAIDELRNNAGTQFDPEIVEAFLRLLEEDPGLPCSFQLAAKESR